MKRIVLLAVAAFTLTLASAPVMAQHNADEEEPDYVGCEVLSNGIGAALYYAGTASGANAWSVGMSAALAYGIKYNSQGACNEVVEATVDAYENAMINLGIQIRWHTYHDPGMEWCLSIKRFHCIPFVEPELSLNPGHQLFARQSWEMARATAERLLSGNTANSAHISPLSLANALQAGFESSGLEASPAMIRNNLGGAQ